MTFSINKFKKKLITIDSIALLYILIVGGLCHILPIPEIVKGFLALPSLLIFNYLFGKSVLYGFEKLSKKELTILNKLDIVSKFIFVWFFGFLLILFVLIVSSSLAHLLEFWLILEYFTKYAFVYAILFIFMHLLFFPEYKTKEYTVKNEFQSIISELYVLGINKKILLLFIFFSIGVVSIAKVFIPFPFFGPGFALPTNGQWVTRLLTDGYIMPAGFPRIMDIEFGYLGEYFFNLNMLTLQWVGNYFLFFVCMVGIYFFIFAISKNRFISLVAAIFGTMFIGITADYGHGMINSFRSNHYLTALLPFMLFFIYQNIGFIKKKTLKKNSYLIILWSIVFIVVFLNSIAYSSLNFSTENSLYFKVLITCLLVVLVILMLFYKKDLLIAFLIISFSTYFIHTEWLFFVFIIFFYYIVLTIVSQKEEYPIFYYILYIFILFSFLVFTMQWLGILTFENNSFISSHATRVTEYQHIDFEWKIDALKMWSNIIILVLSVIGSFLVLLYNKQKEIPILAMFCVVMFFYFIPEGASYRFAKYSAPFVAYLLGVVIYYIYRFSHHTNKYYVAPLILLITIVLLLISSLLPIYLHHLPPQGYSYCPRFADYEYQACDWMRSNLPENTVIITDWFSYFVMTPLSNKVIPIYLDMGTNKSSSPEEDKEKWRIIMENIFGAKNSKDAYDGVQTLKSLQSFTYPGEERYVALKSKSNPNFRNMSYVIVLSGRSTKWFDQKPVKGEFIPRLNSCYSLMGVGPDSKYLALFNDTRYFTLIYNDANKIYVFGVNPDPGIPFKIQNDN